MTQQTHRPFGRREDDLSLAPVAALVLAVDPNGRLPIDPALVAATLGLSPAQSRVAVLLAEGRSVRDIAVAIGRSQNTVRWHIGRNSSPATATDKPSTTPTGSTSAAPSIRTTLGRGIHYCLGPPLARLEGRIVLKMLLERFPEIAPLDDRPRFRGGVVLRGLQSLPLRGCRA